MRKENLEIPWTLKEYCEAALALLSLIAPLSGVVALGLNDDRGLTAIGVAFLASTAVWLTVVVTDNTTDFGLSSAIIATMASVPRLLIGALVGANTPSEGGFWARTGWGALLGASGSIVYLTSYVVGLVLGGVFRRGG